MSWEPLRPGRDEAARRLTEELGDPRYRQSGNDLLSLVRQWVIDRLDALFSLTGPDTGYASLAVLIVIALVIALAVWRTGALRATRRTAVTESPLGPSTRTAAAHRRDAEAASASGDHRTAAVEWFRAMVVGLDERALLEPYPGRTADEAARAACVWFPTETGQLLTAALRFDAIWYGGYPCDAPTAAALRDLDTTIARTTPAARPDAVPPSPAVPR